MEFEYDLVVVGAGWAGLATAKTYHQLHPGRKIRILDRDSTIGGVWSEERLYSGLKTQNLVGTYEYPDFPLVPEEYGLQKGQHIPGKIVHEYLARYAERFDIHDKIWYNCAVESAEHFPGGGWELRGQRGLTGGGPEEGTVQLRTKRLVLATGLTSEAFLPAFEGDEEFGVPIFHSKDFSKYTHTLDEVSSVAVFGGTKSAWDAVYAYASKGVHVDWIIRESGRGPSWHSSPYVTPLKKWLEKLTATRVLTWFSPCIWGSADGYPLPRRLLHQTRLGRLATRAFWWLLGHDVLAANAYDAHPETAKLRPWADPFFIATTISIFNYETDFLGLIRDGGNVRVHVADLVRLGPRGAVHLSDGTALTADLLVCATGWRHVPPLRFLPDGIEKELGLPHVLSEDHDAGDEPYWRRDLVDRADAEILARFPRLRDQPAPKGKRAVPLAERAVISSGPPTVNPSVPSSSRLAPYHLHRFVVPPSPALLATRDVAFTGYMMNFVHAVVSHVHGIWITAYFDGELSPSAVPPPSDAEALEELRYQNVLHNRFGRWRYPSGHGHQFPDFVFDAVPYIDLLLSDLGLVAHRKNGWLTEITQPYGPADYKDLVEEWRAKKRS